ncbi:GIY-YIG nuclease family protein [Kaistella sp.]
MIFYYVYILKCSDNSYYTGITKDLRRRVGEYNDGVNPTCYTHKR